MKDRIFDRNYYESIGSPSYLEKFIGMEYISYSYVNSFIRDKSDWIVSYLLDKRTTSIFAVYGSAIGNYLQTEGIDCHELITEDTRKILDNHLYDLNTHQFEKPVGFVIGKYLFIGFIDVYKNKLLIDIKTGSDKTVKQYSEDSYKQTKIYTYALEQMGLPIPEFIGVKAFFRKGNNTLKHPLRIEGEPVLIEHKYSKEEIEDYIEEVIKPELEEIEDYKRLFKELEKIV